jgi:hypothetical protein
MPEIGEIVGVFINGSHNLCKVSSLIETEDQVISVGLEHGSKIVFAVLIVPKQR